MNITDEARSGWSSTVSSVEVMGEDRSACPGQPKNYYLSNCIWNECKWCMNGILISWNLNNRGLLEQLQLFVYVPCSHHDKSTGCAIQIWNIEEFLHLVYLFLFVCTVDRVSSKRTGVQTYPMRPDRWHFCNIIFVCNYISVLFYLEDTNEGKVKLALCLIN
jgi:hypothetical protein